MQKNYFDPMIGGTVDSTSRTSMLFFLRSSDCLNFSWEPLTDFSCARKCNHQTALPLVEGDVVGNPCTYHIHSYTIYIYTLYIAIFIVIFRLKIYRSTGKSLPSPPSGQRPRKSAAAVSVDLLARCQRLQRCGRLARCRSQAPVALQAAGGHWEAGLRCYLPLKMGGSG